MVTASSSTSSLSLIAIPSNRSDADVNPPATSIEIVAANIETPSVPLASTPLLSASTPDAMVGINFMPISMVPSFSTPLPPADSDNTPSNIDRSMLFVAPDGNVYNSSGHQIVLDSNNVIVDEEPEEPEEPEEHMLAKVVRIQSAMAFKISKMRIDMDAILQYLKGLDAKMDSLLVHGGSTSGFANCVVNVPQRVTPRKPMESVEEFEEFEENLQRLDFQEEMVCLFVKRIPLRISHIFSPFFHRSLHYY